MTAVSQDAHREIHKAASRDSIRTAETAAVSQHTRETTQMAAETAADLLTTGITAETTTEKTERTAAAADTDSTL